MKLIVACMFLGLVTLAAMPASAMDDAAVCDLIKKKLDVINQQAGKMLDAVTREETATADCAAKVVALKWTIVVPGSQLKPGWQDLIKNTVKGNVENYVCHDMDFMEAMAADWKFTGTWTPVSGDPYVLEIGCT